MQDLGFVLLFILFTFIPWLLLRLSGERVNKISVINIVAIAIYIFSIVGIVPLYFGLDRYHVEYLGVIDQFIIFKLLLVSGANLVFLLLGVLFFRKFLNLAPQRMHINCTSDIDFRTDFALKILAFVCVLVFAAYLSKSSSIALVEIITGDAGAGRLARSEMTSAFDGRYFLYALFFQEIGLLLLLASYARLLAFGKGRLFFYSILFFYTLVTIIAAQKAPFANMIIYMMLVYFMVRNNGFVPMASAIKILMLLFVLLGAIFYYFVGFASPLEAVNAVLMRAFSGSISPGYFYLQYYPEHQDYLLGRTIPNPFGVFGYSVSNYIVEIFDFIDPSISQLGIIGTAPIVFWGEVYANFGISAIPFFAFTIGGILAFVSYCASRLPLTPITIGYYVWLIAHFRILSVAGFGAFIYDVYFWSITLIVFALTMKNLRLKLSPARTY